MHVIAYLDPGTGSMIVQLLVGGLAAAGVALKLYWRRVLRLLHIRRDDADLNRPETERNTVDGAAELDFAADGNFERRLVPGSGQPRLS